MGNADASHAVQGKQFWKGNTYNARLYKVQLDATCFVGVAMSDKADVALAVCTIVIVTGPR